MFMYSQLWTSAQVCRVWLFFFSFFLSTCCFTGSVNVCGKLLFLTLFRRDPWDMPEFGSAVTSGQLCANMGMVQLSWKYWDLLCFAPALLFTFLGISALLYFLAFTRETIDLTGSSDLSDADQNHIHWRQGSFDQLHWEFYLEFNTHVVSEGKEFRWVLSWSINSLWLWLFY